MDSCSRRKKNAPDEPGCAGLRDVRRDRRRTGSGPLVLSSGRRSGTVARTISAYDMVVSDAIYGRSERYVSRKRLESMLAYEYELLLERLGPLRGDQTAFFVFADTAASHSRTRRSAGHAWLGVRFQTAPRAEPSDIIVHVATHDSDRQRNARRSASSASICCTAPSMATPIRKASWPRSSIISPASGSRSTWSSSAAPRLPASTIG